jgi:hypothetical protein
MNDSIVVRKEGEKPLLPVSPKNSVKIAELLHKIGISYTPSKSARFIADLPGLLTSLESVIQQPDVEELQSKIIDDYFFSFE